MEGGWHKFHCVEEVSNLISFLRECETSAITRNAIRCNNHNDLLNLSFVLKTPIFSQLYLPSRTDMVQHFFCENCHWLLTQGIIQENNLRVGRGESSKPNPSEVS